MEKNIHGDIYVEKKYKGNIAILWKLGGVATGDIFPFSLFWFYNVVIL